MNQFISKLAVIALLILPSAFFGQEKQAYKPHPLAPSIPQLSEAEYAQIEKIIEQFILYDSGKLPQANGTKILADFEALGPEAIFPLVEGLNQAANLQSSCPAVIIARKVKKLLNASTDGQLLDYVRENVGVGVTIARHMNALKDLKIACMVRKSYLQKSGLLASSPGKKAPKTLSTEELIQAVEKEKGASLKQILIELEQRNGEKVIIALGKSMTTSDKEIQVLAQNLLLKHLNRQSTAELRVLLKNEQEQVRLGTVYLIGLKKMPWGEELIDMLEDSSVKVQQLARQALIQLSGGKDFGPQPSASTSERALAIQSWRNWWKSQSN